MGSSIYDRYAKNLNEIRARYNLAIGTDDSTEKLIDGYLCPITLDYFPDPKVKELSREHVPQEKLGGTILCLTHADWNKGFGFYDNYAVERVKELAKNRVENKFRSRGGFQNGMTGRFELTPGDKPKITFISKACKEDNPKFMAFLESMNNQGEFKINLKPRGQLTRLTKLAYLKNAYLILFGYFGYSVIFGKKGLYNIFSEIRRQLRNPGQKMLESHNFIMEMGSENKFEGVYLIEKDKEKTLGVFYNLIGEISLSICVIFPSLSQRGDTFFNWNKVHTEVQLTKINKPANFLSFESILGGVKAEFVPSDYLSETIK